MELYVKNREIIFKDPIASVYDRISKIAGHKKRRNFSILNKTPYTVKRIVDILGDYKDIIIYPEFGQAAEIVESFENRSKNFNDLIKTSPEVRKTECWKHQLDAFHYAKPLPYCLLSMGVGTGKSKVAIDLLTQWKAKKVLLVNPAYILKDPEAWKKQFAVHCALPYRILSLDKGNTTQKAIAVGDFLAEEFDGVSVVSINYESYWREPLGSFLVTCGFNVTIYDEVHKLKSHDSRSGKFARENTMQFGRILGLTGTVIHDTPLDAYGIYGALDPAIFPKHFGAFRDEYAITYDLGHAKIVQGYKNLEEMAQRVKLITFHVNSDVLDLPEPVVQRKTFVLSPSERKAYNSIKDEMAFEDNGAGVVVDNPMVKALRLAQVTSGYLPLEDPDDLTVNITTVGTSKRDLLEEVLSGILPEKVVVFARFIPDLQAVREVSEKLKARYGEISGRRYDKVAWNRGDIDILGVNVKSGEGIDLTLARYGIFYSKDYSLGTHEQCVGRIQRPGLKEFACFIHLEAQDTVDGIISKAVIEKKDISLEIINHLKR